MRYFKVMMISALTFTLPQASQAVIYNFKSTDTSALSPTPVSFSFSLDTMTAVAAGDGTSFPNITIGRNGVPSTGNTVGASFATNLSSPLFFFVDTTASTPFYSGLGTGISFNLGTFKIADGATDGIGTLTISNASVLPAPEPATGAPLLAGGAMMATIGFRRKRYIGKI